MQSTTELTDLPDHEAFVPGAPHEAFFNGIERLPMRMTR